MGQTLLLSEQDVRALLPMEDVVAAVEKTFRGMGDGTVVNPSKVNLDLGEIAPYPPYNGFMNAMPAYVGFSDVAGLKWAGGNLGERKKRGIPYCSSLILLVNPHINNFIAVLDGALITNMRTGAQTAVALKYLLGLKDGERRPIHLGIYGAGMQGHMQTRAISTLFDIEELRIYDVSRAALERFREDMQSAIPGRIILCDDPKDAAQGDAVICVTQSKDGFLKEEWLSPETIVFPMGSYQECEGITCTIGELVAGRAELHREPGQRIVCLPIGTGAMDIGCASVVYQRALEQKRGQFFDFGVSSATEW